MESYRTIIEPGEVLNIEKKSKFLGFVFPCDSIEEFEEELSRIKQEHHGASHHCYAYRIKENIVMERYNDDREPSQTAGLPILDVLKGQELLQCAIIVVRYYGGTKLGTGGLTRAYSAAARDAVASTDIAVKEEAAIVKVTVGYGMSGKVEYHINAEEVPLIDTVYEQNVGYVIALKNDRMDEEKNRIMELTNGQANIEVVRKTMGFFYGNRFQET